MKPPVQFLQHICLAVSCYDFTVAAQNSAVNSHVLHNSNSNKTSKFQNTCNHNIPGRFHMFSSSVIRQLNSCTSPITFIGFSRFSSRVHNFIPSLATFLHTHKKGKAIPVKVCREPKGCETLRVPNFLDSRITDGGEFVSLMCWPPFPQEDSWYSFLLEAQ
jgi:hypothetical protein